MSTNTITPESAAVALRKHTDFAATCDRLAQGGADIDVTVVSDVLRLDITLLTIDGEPFTGHAAVAFSDHADAAAVAATAYERITEVASVVLGEQVA
ncbi:hypothetical protein [Mycobacterium sp. SMC-19]|uniref:hypothetical protein n=1 Tax=Mycobacterium sp. SMC-19 TaxID=3381630 RepID=UPI003875E719